MCDRIGEWDTTTSGVPAASFPAHVRQVENFVERIDSRSGDPNI
jgi:hypothetical protein